MAAGLGFKTFNTGDVLTAADVNGYLMQGVLVFADATARDAAITSPQEGQFAYTKDNNSLWYYTGSAWAASGATGDIEGVTAGTGISGGGTSGTVTITNSMATEITAAGDIIVGTGSGTFDNLPIGTTGQVLTADTTVSPYKVKWAAAAAGGGKLLQLVNATYATATTLSTTTWTDIGLSASITPTSSSSKILVMIAIPVYIQKGSQADAYGSWKLLRGSTDLIGMNIIGNTTGADPVISLNYHWYDNPATTSSTTYKVQGKVFIAGMSAIFQYKNSVFGDSSITLMEIGA